MRARHGAVYLIDYNNRLFSERQRLFKHKAGLRHTALKRIYKQQNAVHHLQNALNLAAEIGMSRGIDNIYFNTVIHNARVF